MDLRDSSVFYIIWFVECFPETMVLDLCSTMFWSSSLPPMPSVFTPILVLFDFLLVCDSLKKSIVPDKYPLAYAIFDSDIIFDFSLLLLNDMELLRSSAPMLWLSIERFDFSDWSAASGCILTRPLFALPLWLDGLNSTGFFIYDFAEPFLLIDIFPFLFYSMWYNRFDIYSNLFSVIIILESFWKVKT